jgi:hypothetical protein
MWTIWGLSWRGCGASSRAEPPVIASFVSASFVIASFVIASEAKQTPVIARPSGRSKPPSLRGLQAEAICIYSTAPQVECRSPQQSCDVRYAFNLTWLPIRRQLFSRTIFHREHHSLRESVIERFSHCEVQSLRAPSLRAKRSKPISLHPPRIARTLSERRSFAAVSGGRGWWGGWQQIASLLRASQ